MPLLMASVIRRSAQRGKNEGQNEDTDARKPDEGPCDDVLSWMTP
jgi:hypothetical protein